MSPRRQGATSGSAGARPEEELLFSPNRTGAVSVALAYPNTYRVGMGNLGFQAVFRLFSTTEGLRCERWFLPQNDQGRPVERKPSPAPQRRGDAPGSVSGDLLADRADPVASCTLESGRHVAEFDLLAFSLSFESDYPNIVRMLDSAGIPVRASERRNSPGRYPLLIAGGPATFLNPEPVADIFDLFLIGEAEEMLPEAVARASVWPGESRERVLEDLASVEGAYLPSDWSPEYDGPHLAAFSRSAGGPARVRRRYVTDLDKAAVTTAVRSPSAVFGEYFLVEASRGCEWGCRFCAAGYMYRPVRHRRSEGVARDALAGLKQANTIGLVGAEMASHPGIARTCGQIVEAGGRASPSSLKADQISPELAAAVAAGGTRSATVAPEAGSERMRRVINKNLSESEILRAADLMVGDGVESLKLYYMCALPTETEADLDGIFDLTLKVRELMMGHGRKRGRVGRIKVSLNPFVPKPWTPLQWDPMVPVQDAQRRIGGLRKRFGAVPNVDMDAESPREAYLQTLLSRGDRRVLPLIEAIARDGRGWWQVVRSAQRGQLDGVDVRPDDYVTREYGGEELLPWDFIDHSVTKSYLWLERRRALAERETEPCDVSTCRTCGAC